jgi:ribosomal protein S18 acetylase RimI-like enzyme
MTDWALELADNPNTYTPLGPDSERVVTDRFVLWMGRQPGWNVAQRFRFRAEELDEVRAELHAALRERGRSELAWEVGSFAEPADLVERLEALGLAVTERQVGMVLDRAPDDVPSGIEVRRVETDDEWFEAEKIAVAAFGEKVAAKRRPYTPEPSSSIYLAYVDGKPAARGSAVYTDHGVSLFGGATLPEARGRGAYRAVVAARWEDAVARGTPLLVTQASPMSHPILTRLGFREVCRIVALSDRVDG